MKYIWPFHEPIPRYRVVVGQNGSSRRGRTLTPLTFGSGISFEDLESRLLEEAVRRSDGNLAGAARLLGITRPQLQYRLKKKDVV